MPNLDKLKGVMVEKSKTYADGAHIIGCSVASFSAKMNGKSNYHGCTSGWTTFGCMF